MLTEMTVEELKNLMVSAGAQLILAEAKEKGSNLHDIADYAAVQINDTHPSMVIPELIRLLMEEGISFDEATEIVTDVCAYTNHTILAEEMAGCLSGEGRSTAYACDPYAG